MHSATFCQMSVLIADCLLPIAETFCPSIIYIST
jgi:hypothetical protein